MARIVSIGGAEYLQVSADEMSTLENALQVAAERFDLDAVACASYSRIAEQFKRQAELTRKLRAEVTS